MLLSSCIVVRSSPNFAQSTMTDVGFWQECTTALSSHSIAYQSLHKELHQYAQDAAIHDYSLA
jgi:hypothetical protein